MWRKPHFNDIDFNDNDFNDIEYTFHLPSETLENSHLMFFVVIIQPVLSM